MADDSTDTAFVFILFVLFLALLGYAAGGGGWPSSTACTRTAHPTHATQTPGPYTSTARSDTNIPTGRLQSGQGEVVANKTARSSNGSVNLKVYYTKDND